MTESVAVVNGFLRTLKDTCRGSFRKPLRLQQDPKSIDKAQIPEFWLRDAKRSPTLDLRQTESGMFSGVAAVSPDRAVAGPENPLRVPTRILDFACDPRLFRCQFRPLAVNLLLFKT